MSYEQLTINNSALELSSAIKEKKLGVVEAVGAYIEKIEKNDKLYNAFLGVAKDAAIERAKKVQKQIDAAADGNALSPLAGVPVAIKGNIGVAGFETNCASKMLQGYKPVFNATVVEKMEEAGMIIVGTLNMDEFAMGGSSETGINGAVRNPWDLKRSAGGSSGGCAAAISADEIPLALGSDTGGSIRQPCGFCGVTGIKPTYGAVSRYGAVAFASSLDQIGPMGKNIDDCAALLSIISGPDKKDSTCIIKEPFAFDEGPSEAGQNKGFGYSGKIEGIKIGLPSNYFLNGIDEDVKDAVLAAAKEFESAGAVIEEFEMPMLDYVVPAYYVIACAEASSNLSRFDGLKYGYRSPNAASLSEVYRLSRSEGFGLEVKRRIMLGSFVLSSGYYDAYYKKALQARTLIKNAYHKIFERFDLILSPVSPATAYKIGEITGDPIKMYMGDIFTSSVNLAGIPAAALPCGFDKQGLPIGFQLIGDAFCEKKIINAARVYQNLTDYHTKKPGVIL